MFASRRVAFAAVPVLAILGLTAPAQAAPPPKGPSIDHIVVIYEENHSFDNLYGGWERVNGLSDAAAAHTTQVNQAGAPFQCLYMDDANLQAQSPANPAGPLSTTCSDSTITSPAPSPFPSHFANTPFMVD